MLMIPCPSCDKLLKGPDSLAGKRVRCPNCKEVITVPGEPAPPRHPQPDARQPSDFHSLVSQAGEALWEDEPIPRASNDVDANADEKPLHGSHVTETVSAPPAEIRPSPSPEFRDHYFAPAGYAELKLASVPFVAPELRHLLPKAGRP
jgi:phage FluMu protein Com